MSVGSQVLVELIVTWSEDGLLKERVFVAVLIYDVDGAVLLDRSPIEMANWLSSLRLEQERPRASQDQLRSASYTPSPSRVRIKELSWARLRQCASSM
jgi:hypothetical protein